MDHLVGFANSSAKSARHDSPARNAASAQQGSPARNAKSARHDSPARNAKSARQDSPARKLRRRATVVGHPNRWSLLSTRPQTAHLEQQLSKTAFRGSVFGSFENGIFQPENAEDLEADSRRSWGRARESAPKRSAGGILVDAVVVERSLDDVEENANEEVDRVLVKVEASAGAVPGCHLSCPPQLVSAELACVLPAETEEPVVKCVNRLSAKTVYPDLERHREVWS